MNNVEIPLGKKTALYRFFEMLPAIMSYGAIILIVVLSIINPIFAAIYLLLMIVSLLVKSIGMSIHTIGGRRRLENAQRVDWHSRLNDLEYPKQSYDRLKNEKLKSFKGPDHIQHIKLISKNPDKFPKPSQIYNAIIIASVNESYDILGPTVQSVLDTTYDNKRIILVLAYEERGGVQIEKTINRLYSEFKDKFYAMHLVKHPKDMPNEVMGKGGNITYAGKFLSGWINDRGINPSNVIVTTLDSDNKPYRSYFDYVTYEYIVHEDRKHISYQPVCLFTSNIWDVPAPMRVIATGNSFWNIISSMRPHILRNFASHSQPLDALEGMNFWSTRTIVEDGHQYWRSYFYFKGRYAVMPIYVPVYQDAVLSDTYLKTLKAQFKQLRRWAYGVSDISYVATRIFTKDRRAPFWGSMARFIRLIDSHVTWACMPILVTFGGWIPLLVNSKAARSISAHQLPDVVSVIQQIALVGLFITIFLSFKVLPPRPARYKRRRTVMMVIQWLLMPITSIVYSSVAALNSQTRLLFGRYLDKFDVTDKATVKPKPLK